MHSPRRPARWPAACLQRWTQPRQPAGTSVAVSPPRCSWCLPAGEPWEVLVSLRVEDHPEPLVELRRLYGVHRAYELAVRGDALTNEGRHDEAAVLYRQASELAPDNHELLFWSGLGTALSGEVDHGVALVREAIALHPGWAELLPRLTPDVAPAAPVVAERLGLQLT